MWTASGVLSPAVKQWVTLLAGCSTFTLFFQYVIPNVLEYSHILLPFALSNGMTALCVANTTETSVTSDGQGCMIELL